MERYVEITDEYLIEKQRIRDLYERKPFICKGKHQYREIISTKNGITEKIWACQCGRKIGA